VASKRPGNKVEITYKRDNKSFKTSILLKNKEGKIQLTTKTERESRNVLGTEISDVTTKEKEDLSIASGIKILKLGSGKIKNSGVKNGFIVTHLSKQGERNAVKDTKHFIKLLASAEKDEEGVYLEGIYENGSKAYYPIGW
jgi:serine protease Do